MRKIVAVWLLFVLTKANAQTSLPVSVYRSSDTSKPLVLYVSGDGGLSNSFAPLLKKMNAQGFCIIGLNSQSYFWKKKDPQRAAEDFTGLLTYYMNAWHCKSYVLVGYSFGADVIPFIENRLSPEVAAMNKYTILMSPSKRTNFKIHILGMLGFEPIHGCSIPEEINRMKGPVAIFRGSEEHQFTLKQITATNVHVTTLPGGHHYHGDVNGVVRRIMETIR